MKFFILDHIVPNKPLKNEYAYKCKNNQHACEFECACTRVRVCACVRVAKRGSSRMKMYVNETQKHT